MEDHPGGCGFRVHGGAPAAAALLAARVGRQGHLHTRLTEGRTHSSAQDHGRILLSFFLVIKAFSSAVLKTLVNEASALSPC